jgi:CHAD domain-containing protein
MRVATKRLREAARVFQPAFGKARMGRHLEHLERLNDGLGVGRELDVLQIQFGAIAARLDGLAEGLRPLMEHLAEERRAADKNLIPTLEATLPFIADDFERLVHDRTRAHAAVWDMSFARLGRRAVSRRAAEAFGMEEAACAPGASVEFHRMRIAVKRLKYALEVFLGVVGKPAKKAYKPIAELQEVMGEVHDRDVLLGVLREANGGLLKPAVVKQAARAATADRASLHTQTLALLASMHEEKIAERLS